MANVKFLTHVFNLTLYHKYFADRLAFVLAHGNNQLTLQDRAKYLSSDHNDTSVSVNLQVVFTKIEILKRRNKRNQPCNRDWNNWDAHFISKYAKEVGCIAPYLDPLENVPICEKQM